MPSPMPGVSKHLEASPSKGGLFGDSRRDLSTSAFTHLNDTQSMLSTLGVRLRIETVVARKAEVVQRLADLHLAVDGDSTTPVSNVAVSTQEELASAQQELVTLSQQQCDLEVALAKVSAREKKEPGIQTACGACARLNQKLTAHRAEVDRKLEVFRAEMTGSAADREAGRKEASAVLAADEAQREAMKAKVAETDAQAREIAELRRKYEEGNAQMTELESQGAERSVQLDGFRARHEELCISYQRLGEGYVEALTCLEALKAVPGSVPAEALQTTETQAAAAVASVEGVDRALGEVHQTVTTARAKLRDMQPSQDQISRGEGEIEGLFSSLATLTQKHSHLSDYLGQQKISLEYVEEDLHKVENWVRIAASPPDLRQHDPLHSPR